MAIYKCKMCGGQLNSSSEDKIIECDYCGTTQTLPKTTDPNIQSLFNRATTLLQKAEYDKAEEIYEKIISIDEKESEAYWGVILCKYGIEYVEDPKTFKRIPTCHRSSYDSVIADEDYKKALFYSDIMQRNIYEQEAKTIDEIQKGILEIASKEELYDIFISYKESDEYGRRTSDSAIANDIYYQLTNAGYKVFYSAITLEDKLGKEFEPIIFSALHSAKVMLVIGTKVEYLNAIWVKNEWSRFLKLMKNDRTKLLIPCYKDIDPYELPDEFSHLQAQDMNKIGFINDLIRGIKKVLTKEETQVVVNNNNDNNQSIEKLIKRAFIFIEDGQFEEANEYCEKVLDIDVEYGKAYLGKLLAEFKIKIIEDIEYINYKKLENNLNLSKIYKYCDQKTIDQIKSIIDKNSNTLYFSQKDIDSGELQKYLSNEVIPSISFDSSVKEIKKSYFEKANKFRKIIIPSSVSKIEDNTLDSIYIEDISVDSNNRYYSSIEGNLYSKDGETLIKYAKGKNEKKIIIPSSVIKIAEDAFGNAKNLENIVIPSNLKSIGYRAFIGCKNLKNVYYNGTIQNWCNIKMNDSPMYIDSHFYMLDNDGEYKKITELEIPNTINSIGNNQFSYFYDLIKVTIPSSVTNIGDCAFNSCKNLKCVIIPKSVKSIGEAAFGGLSKRTKIYCEANYEMAEQYNYFPNPQKIHVEYWSIYVTSVHINSIIEVDDFEYQKINDEEVQVINYLGNNKKIVLPQNILLNNTVYAVTKIENMAFRNYTNLESIVIPSSVTTIGSSAFDGCSSLTSITIPNSVTSIGLSAFGGCSSLTSITIPSSVINICYGAFLHCDKLTICCEVKKRLKTWDKQWNSVAYKKYIPVIWNNKKRGFAKK